MGLIFDIQRSSLRDGPGIRTTVFLKGCPLRCVWCHNPESQSSQPELSFNRERCMVCGLCAQTCEYDVHRLVEGQHILARDECITCGQCISACPQTALKIIGEAWSTERILDEVERDSDYYQVSGGGLTLSGGEPMAEFDFTLALLTEAKTRGLHTCLETSGTAPLDQFVTILPVVDLFLFDYKATDPEKHRELTGVSNSRLLSNLDFLMHRGAAVILRCPLVPGINDSVEHLAGIARLAARYPDLQGVELMPYHDLGKTKSEQIGATFRLAHILTTESTITHDWLATLRSLGCMKATLG